jgi:hypothetical protein
MIQTPFAPVPKHKTVALVLPTCRMFETWKFLDAWQPSPWDMVVVVHDQDHPLMLQGREVDFNLCWADLDKLGAAGQIFSRRDAAIRAFGFLVAVEKGADIIVTLDDDCFPVKKPRSFINQHLRNLYQTTPWASTVPGVAVRGMPYARQHKDYQDRDVMVSMGLWENVADFDAVHTLMRCKGGLGGFKPPRGVRIMPAEQLFPFCGMNVAFRAEALPAMYFPKMGEGSPYSRFDDIWCGLVMQRALAATGYRVAVGEPFVEHVRASNPFKNLIKEAAGVEANEYVWRLFDKIGLNAEPDLAENVLQIASRMVDRVRDLPTTLAAYVESWADSLGVWVRLCRAVRPALSSRSDPAWTKAAAPLE